MKKLNLTVCAMAISYGVFSQGWIGESATNSLTSFNSTLGLAPLNVGIGTNAPTTQFHTTGGVRFQGITEDNTRTRVMVQDPGGNIFWRDASTIGVGNFWSLTGNTGTNPTINFLGTKDAERLVFRTNDVEKMTILSGGNVGIGIATPSLKLQLQGNSIGNEPLTNVENSAGIYDNRAVAANVGGQLFFGGTFDAAGDVTTYGGIRGIKLNATSGDFSGQLEFYTRNNGVDTWAGAQRMVINNIGNVGIGTSTPSTQLHTTGGVRFQGLTASPFSNIVVIDPNGNLATQTISAIGVGNFWSLTGNAGTNPATNFLGTTDAERLVFRTNDVEKMTILPGGNVGIGTSTPIALLQATGNTLIGTEIGNPFAAPEKLQVLGSSIGNEPLTNVSNSIGIYDNNAVAANVGGQLTFCGTFTNAGGGDRTTFAGIRGIKLNAIDGDYSGQLEFYTRNNGVDHWAGAQRMVIDHLGNVGIGTSTPSTQLHTTGGVRFQGLAASAFSNAVVIDANGNLATQPLSALGATLNCTQTNFIPKVTAANTLGCSQIFDNGTNVGIGTTTPSLKLQSVGSSIGNEPLTNLANTLGIYDNAALAANVGGQLFFGGTFDNAGDLTTYAGIRGIKLNATSGDDSGQLEFYTRSNGVNTWAGTQRMVIDNNGNVGIGTSTPTALLTVSNGTTTGTYTTSGWVSSSDGRLKNNIQPINDPIQIINKLNGIYYNWINNSKAGRQLGFIAQDVKTVLPEVVSGTEGDITKGETLGMAYQNIVPVLVEAIKEQQKMIDSLKTIIKNPIKNNQDSINAALQNQLNKLLSAINTSNGGSSKKLISDTTGNQTNVNLSNSQIVVLAQNVPNPFAEQTTINYFLPDNTTKAEILFYNSQGMLIKTTNLTQTGSGSVNVFADDLSSGIYTYTLVVNGQIVDSKKMIKE